ncbi:MAG TPA: iron-sulfur cluster assembly scaffold protein [Steroidobacteraceae bacterium]|nr:iron-sulfur cluster assembly scaffold protein [Steroidobacteraceae bacterium]
MRYNEMTLRYFESAPAAGTLDGPQVATGTAGERQQGAWVQFQIRLETPADGGTRIAAAQFLAFGCPHTIATAAWVAEQAPGGPVSAELPLPVEALRRLFGVPVEKLGRLLVVEDAWRAVIATASARVET